MNSSYGKLGQKQYRQTLIVNATQLPAYVVEAYNITALGPDPDDPDALYKVQFPYTDDIHVGYMVYIANFIAAKARYTLLEFIYWLEKRGYGVYYSEHRS